jgi:hypothetical protein
MEKIIRKIVAICLAFIYFGLPIVGAIYYLVCLKLYGKEAIDDFKDLWNSED